MATVEQRLADGLARHISPASADGGGPVCRRHGCVAAGERADDDRRHGLLDRIPVLSHGSQRYRTELQGSARGRCPAGAAGVAVGSLLNEGITKLIPGADTLGTKLFELVNPAEATGEAFGKMSFTAKDFGIAIEDQNTSVDVATTGLKSLLTATEAARLGEEALTQATINATVEINKQGGGIAELGATFTNAGDFVSEYNGQLATTERHHGTLFKVIVDAETGLKTYSQAVDATAQSLDKQTEKTDKVTESTENFKIEMEKIASNERIKNIEAKISLDIANVEANAQIVTAAFESIDTGIESTGKLIGDLFGVLLDANSWAQRRLIEEQLQKENDRRDQAFKLQKELTEAEINLIKEKTRRLAKGDALIKIDGDGLQPQLEAFMWEVLNAIQVRANAEGSEFLLGVA